MEITCRVYRPRRARESPLYRLVEQHIEELLRVWPQRFARTHGPLRPVVERVLRGFLTCGIVSHGFARLWCPTCRTSVLCPFSCRGRSFCPSCEKKRQLLWAEWLQKEVLAPVPHRHVVLTMPRLLRGIFWKRRELLLDLSQSAAEAVAEYIERHAISETLARKLPAWRHPGFSAHVGEAIPFEDKKAIEDVACYVVRSALSLKKLVYLDGQKAVLYRSRMNPSLGRNFEAMDPLEWLARLADHIPDPGKHRTHFYAHYANRVRGERPPEEVTSHGDNQEQPKKRRCSPSWARLISKVFHADPLVCKRCGGPLKVVAYITDTVAIRQILDHLDLSPLEKPAPDVREVVRVPVDDEGREIAANPA